METLLVVPVFTIAVALFAVLILLHFVPMGLWISALAADVSISLFNLVGMRFRRVAIDAGEVKEYRRHLRGRLLLHHPNGSA